MTGLHAVHVLGGLVPLAMVTVAAYQGMYGRKKHAAVRYTAVYWHFLDCRVVCGLHRRVLAVMWLTLGAGMPTN